MTTTITCAQFCAEDEFQLKQTDANPWHAEGAEVARVLQGAELELLNKACKVSGKSLAFWARLTEGLDEGARAMLVSRARMFSSELPGSCNDLPQDQKEAVTLLSLVGRRDRQVFLRALRSLVELRAGRKN
ncbi:hypothetical protein N6L27_07275 [Leisingera sp. SS27]|uniref:hypothetical protein n=1 Tax=Leisingera sp. SS27 TaxID=2979462 RepID=UPI00232CD604|nr:hypothetical protein [Leisingera sp. SS27]MDC0657791.1 hypothetical protein [Leisingera sp. SS27]